jgi:hypothetical protein
MAAPDLSKKVYFAFETLHEHVLPVIGEAKAFHQQLPHVFNVIHRTPQLGDVGIVVDSHEKRQFL